MSKMTKKEHQQKLEQELMATDDRDWYELTHKNWRAWGSWFSWGSPVGLGLFFIETAAAIWILTQAF